MWVCDLQAVELQTHFYIGQQRHQSKNHLTIPSVCVCLLQQGLALWPRLASNSRSSCLILYASVPTEITGCITSTFPQLLDLGEALIFKLTQFLKGSDYLQMYIIFSSVYISQVTHFHFTCAHFLFLDWIVCFLITGSFNDKFWTWAINFIKTSKVWDLAKNKRI
jgi:hypothetical protein